jgi:hypothetical protein
MNNLSEYFNKIGSQSQRIATDKWFLGTAAVCAVLAFPFSATAALVCLSVPTACYGLGMATRTVGAALAALPRGGPKPG